MQRADEPFATDGSMSESRALMRTSPREHGDATGLSEVTDEFASSEFNTDRTALQFVEATEVKP